jgi:hypothetical protein
MYPDVGPVFEASYPGECPCGKSFDERDELRYVDGDLLAQACCGHEYDDEFDTQGTSFTP